MCEEMRFTTHLSHSAMEMGCGESREIMEPQVGRYRY